MLDLNEFPIPDSRLLAAIDVGSLAEAEALFEKLEGTVEGVKIGKRLFTAAGPAAIEKAMHCGFRVFLDLKFHDTPNTVAGAIDSASSLGVFMVNVHASGGLEMMRAAAEAAAQKPSSWPLVIGVTVLTSLDRKKLNEELKVEGAVSDHVIHLAGMALEAGLDGVVASSNEALPLRELFGERIIIVTPGIRLPGGKENDQIRVAAPRAAMRAGSDFLVVGRPLTEAVDPAQAAEIFLDEMLAGWCERMAEHGK